MRLPVYPGRGGRGHPTLPTPKYLLEHKAIYATRMEMLKKNRFSLLDQTEDCFDNDSKHIELTCENEGREHDLNKNNDKRNMKKEIPDSLQELQKHCNAPGNRFDEIEDIENFTTVLRTKRKKKKYLTRSPKDFYDRKHKTSLEESNKQKFHGKEGNMTFSQNVRPLSQIDESDMNMEEPSTMNKRHKDYDKEVNVNDVMGDTDDKKKLWEQILYLCEEMDVRVNIEKDDDIEMLKEAVHSLKTKQSRGDAIETTRMTSKTIIVSPDGKCNNKKQRREEENYQDEEMQNVEIELNEDRDKCIKLLNIIKEVAKTIHIEFATKEEEEMKLWDIHKLRKKLGEVNVMKKEYAEKNNIIKASNDHDRRVTFSRITDSRTYSESGLNVQAVSNIITPTKQSGESMYKPPEVDKVAQKEVQAQMRHSYTARLRLAIHDTNVNVGLILKKMFRIWKDADPSINLLAHAEECNNAMMIDDENKVPCKEEEVQQYIMPGMYQRDGKLHISLRFSGHLSLPLLKKKIFTWMRRNNSFATIDRVQAALVHTIGFLHCVQPDYYNREDIKTQIKKCLEPLEIGDDVNVFARKIWMRYKGTKIETRALVLEVPKDAREEINAAMMGFKIENCADMTYVPFAQVADEFYDSTMKEIFLSQNIYLHRTKSRTVYGIGEPNKKFTTKGDETMSFREWIETITFDTKFFLDACVVGPSGYLHLIYDEDYEKTVQKLFGKNFQEYAKDHFYEEDIKEIFTDSKITIKMGRQTSKEDQDYAEFLKRKFSANPQDIDQGIKKRDPKSKTYAEASMAPPQRKQRMNLHYSQFSEASTVTLSAKAKKVRVHHSDDINRNIQEVMQRIEDLEKNRIDPAPKEMDWEKTLNEELDSKMAIFQTNFEIKMGELEKKTENRMKKSEELIIGKLNEIQLQNMEDITKSFDSRMDEMGGKLDRYMQMFINKLGSTDNTRHKSDVSVVGKRV